MEPRKEASLANSAPLSIMAYCFASISMTVVNKYCVSGQQWNLNFFYLAFQVTKHPVPMLSASRLTLRPGRRVSCGRHPVQGHGIC